MDERKYEVVDPDSSKYKLTADDLKKEKRKEKKKGKKALKVLIALLLVFAIIIGGIAVFINVYLSKMNYGDLDGQVDPNLEAEEVLDFDGQSDADNAIKKNLDDSVLWYDDRIYNILLVGYDLGDEEKVMFEGAYLPRSDSMILLSINTIKNVVNMVSLSRAAYVAIPGHGNKRLNTAHAYGGATTLVETIELNYKIRIDKYITVDFSGFKSIIDILGGVDIDMTQAEAKNIMGTSAAGSYHLDGEHALSYSRLRSIDTDRARTGRQRNVLNAIAGKLRHSSVSTLLELVDETLPMVTTNFSKAELISQATKAPKYISMSIHEDIIPFKAQSLSLREGKEVLILDWAATNKHTHKLLYPDMTPQSFSENK